MSSLPAVTAGEAIKAFQAAGFAFARQSSSHVILKKDGHPHALSIPCHGSQNLKPGLLRGQIRTAGMTVDEFIALLA